MPAGRSDERSNDDSRSPTFLIIGAAKSGTTSLWAYLDQHPDVFLSPNKEPNYFALAGEKLPDGGPATPDVLLDLIHGCSITDYAEYSALFKSVHGKSALGEASVRYLYYEAAAQRIRDTLPNVRLVALLREPAARLYSHYYMNVQYQLEPLPLLDALDAEDGRVAQGWGWDWHYQRVSSYAQQLQRYFKIFDAEQIKVFLYQDFAKRPLEVYRDVCRHIGVRDDFVPDVSKRAKVTSLPRNLALDRWLNWPNSSRAAVLGRLPKSVEKTIVSSLNRLNGRPVPKMEPALRSELQRRFRDDIEELESLLNRSTGWLERGPKAA